MPMRWIVVGVLVAFAVLGFVAWNRSQQPVPEAQPPAPVAEPAPVPVEDPHVQDHVDVAPLDPGLEWQVPPGWTDQGPRNLRLATYVITGTGSAARAECAVYYFGPGQGGPTDSNLDRWIGEFENPGTPERTRLTVNGIAVARVRVNGGYLAHSGSMGGAMETALPDHELLGAIVEGPQGSLFFKLVGPAKTVDAAVADFDRMIASVRKR
jgi:hypothetical protein